MKEERQKRKKEEADARARESARYNPVAEQWTESGCTSKLNETHVGHI